MTLGIKIRGIRAIKSPGGVYKYVHEELIRCWKEAVRAFIHACVDNYEVHVDTGMSMASFYPLATNVKLGSFVEKQIFAAPGRRPPRKPAYDIEGNEMPNVYKSREQGKLLGQEAYDLEFGSPLHPVFKFQFHIVIFQYLLHERGVGGSAPWDTLHKGEDAFRRAFYAEFHRRLSAKEIIRALLLEGRIVYV